MHAPPLTPASVHLWHIPLTRRAVAADPAILGEAERARGARFATPALRRNFLVTHTAKRRILAHYLDIPAKELALSANPYGKPCLTGACAAAGIRFNLSHTRTTAVLAVTLGHETGIDIEALGRSVEVMPLAERYFSDSVLRHLEELSGSDQRRAFLRYWTQFEAYKKALGYGLRGEDTRLSLQLAERPDNRFQPVLITAPPAGWQAAELDYLPGYAISVVIEANLLAPELSWQEFTADPGAAP